MLMLLFYIGDERYALEIEHVVEVFPMVALKKLHHAPDYIAGLFNYRGRIVPAIDLCTLIHGNPCRYYLSTRIILINYLDSDQTEHLWGLIAERVTETLNKSETDFIDPGITVDGFPYLGKIITDEQGMIQFVRVENLLSSSQQAYLLPSDED
ncbi:MAG: chemotaxis protein CheW [Chamaesiphon sp.]